MARIRNDQGSQKKIEMHYGSKILYANTLWNNASDAFCEAEDWNELLEFTSEAGFEIKSIDNADPFYYSHFIELVKR